jgi:proteasome lid subunit RPN8/RPN11
MTETYSKCAHTVENCYVLLGEFRNGVVHAKMSWRRKGSHSAVEFDWSKAMVREEEKGDVVGFYHTHPEGFVLPSHQDETTMQAWAFSFGKPLVCAIGTSVGVRAWVFETNGVARELDSVELFKPNWLVGFVRGT